MFADISNEMLIRWYNRYRGDNNVIITIETGRTDPFLIINKRKARENVIGIN